jgi:hypothetical protein
MKRIAWLVIIISSAAWGQISNPGVVNVTGGVLIVSSAPSGACAQGVANQQLVTTGVQYSCQNITAGTGTWAVLASGASTTATNLAGGSATAVPYQSAASTTAFDVTNLSWTDSGTYLAIGPVMSLVAYPGTLMSYVGTSGSQDYIQVVCQDKNVQGSCAYVIGGDDMTNTTHYANLSKNGSGSSRNIANVYFINADATSEYTTDAEMDYGAGLVTGNAVFNWYTNTVPTLSMNLTATALTMGTGVNIVTPGNESAATHSTATNCAINSASPGACASAAAGAFVIPTLTATYTVNTTAVTTHSRIFLTPITFAADLPSTPTCVIPLVTTPWSVSAIVASTSFTVTLTSTTGQTCFYYSIVD